VEFAYRPELWQSLFDMVARAREALIALTVLLTVAIFVLIPEQGRVALGVELLVLSILVWGVSLRLQWRTVRALPAQRRRSWIGRLIGFDTAIVGITLAGVGLVTGRLGGFLWLLPTVLICLIWSTYNAWSLTIDAIDRHQDKTP